MGHHWTDYHSKEELDTLANNRIKLETAKKGVSSIIRKLCTEHRLDSETELVLINTFTRILNEFSGLR